MIKGIILPSLQNTLKKYRNLPSFESRVTIVVYSIAHSIFFKHTLISKELVKPIILYYNMNSHGRGLLDAMSHFRVKTPLNKTIVSEVFFNTDKELLAFLTKVHAEDEHKYFQCIPAKKKKKKLEETSKTKSLVSQVLDI